MVTQIDGATVGVKEAKEFVKAKLVKDAPGLRAGENVMMKALDYTSKSAEDQVVIKVNGKTTTIKKNFLQPLELFETGVYNSETDLHSNPKTSENKPDKNSSLFSSISDKSAEILYGLKELRTFVKDNSKLSHEVFDRAISDIESYISSLESESEATSGGFD